MWLVYLCLTSFAVGYSIGGLVAIWQEHRSHKREMAAIQQQRDYIRSMKDEYRSLKRQTNVWESPF